MHLVAAPGRDDLARALGAALGTETTTYERQVFPDGERYVRVGASLTGPAAVLADLRPNDLLVEALLALDATREAGAHEVVLLVPYLSYARQDRAFHPGEAVSARAILGALGTRADQLVTVDLHTETALDHFPGEAINEVPALEIAEALGERGVDLVLAPDKGARGRAAMVAEILGTPHDHLEKTRLSATEVQMAPKDLSVEGATVAIVDDIISTGGTMATATAQLLEAGAERVLVAATHGLFVKDAEKRLEAAGVAEVLVTDTVRTGASVVSCAGALARGLGRVRRGSGPAKAP